MSAVTTEHTQQQKKEKQKNQKQFNVNEAMAKPKQRNIVDAHGTIKTTNGKKKKLIELVPSI